MVQVEEKENGYVLYSSKASLKITVIDGAFYIHDLIGDPEDKYAVIRLTKRAIELAKQAEMNQAIVSIGIEDKRLMETYARLGFTISHVWMSRGGI